MPSRIFLIRHGRSSHVASRSWLGWEGYERWRDAYDAAGIDTTGPPASLTRALVEVDDVVTSDMRRAVESAARLAPSARIESTSLLREYRLPCPTIPGLRLPVAGWEGLVHLGWGSSMLVGRDPSLADMGRARAAIDWIEARGEASAAVAAVTHGVFRRLLARQLQQRGWKSEAGLRRYDCWSVWVFTREA